MSTTRKKSAMSTFFNSLSILFYPFQRMTKRAYMNVDSML
ncbi:hypothetical protein J2Z32_004214 [Paenibacillus turicensis]|uniref:Uncharacterized protein n=1 Tax=Paenibacillus turicensis TaxID=160487 RepID=A0ABS4FYB5_9BACL|nr:hypothetical protein [Paenibacillus turicensis]